MAANQPETFPKIFWTANVTELFERAAYYSIASFVVIYLGQLGFGEYWPSNLNGILWTLVYFLPILSGTIADQVGFRKSLLVAFVLLAAGYSLMGFPVWFGGAELAPIVGADFTAPTTLVVTVVLAVLLIGAGGSVIKPCISGTVQKTSGMRATLGFAIFYMIINIGSLFGRGVAYVVRRGYSVGTVLGVVAVCAVAAFGLVYLVNRSVEARKQGQSAWMAVPYALVVVVAGSIAAWVVGRGARLETASSLSYIFAVAAVASVAAFFVVLFFYREPERAADVGGKPRRSIGRILLDMVLVLKSGRFTLFLIVMSGFFFLYNQVYNVLPLYAKRVVETNPAMDLYTAANPFVIVAFQLLITSLFGKMKAIRSIIIEQYVPVLWCAWTTYCSAGQSRGSLSRAADARRAAAAGALSPPADRPAGARAVRQPQPEHRARTAHRQALRARRPVPQPAADAHPTSTAPSAPRWGSSTSWAATLPRRTSSWPAPLPSMPARASRISCSMSRICSAPGCKRRSSWAGRPGSSSCCHDSRRDRQVRASRPARARPRRLGEISTTSFAARPATDLHRRRVPARACRHRARCS